MAADLCLGSLRGGNKQEEGRMGREDTAHGKGAQVERLVVHGGIVGEDFARVVVSVRAAAGIAKKASGVLVGEDGAVAEEATQAAVPPEEGRHGRIWQQARMSVLQPEYFSADIFVAPLRRDIAALIHAYRTAYHSAPHRPFALFKRAWRDLRWHWLLFKVYDPRARHAFLSLTLRLFLGL
jgi:hypothetical protein